MEIFDELIESNQKIHAAEKHGDIPFFERALTEDFIFRRADGEFTDKESYLEELAGTTYDILELSNVEPVLLTRDSGYVTCRITTEGRRPDGTRFQDSFIDTRFLKRRATNWVVFAWHSVKATSPSANERSFTGDVIAQTLSEDQTKKTYQVFFHPSARTHWHIHTGVQVLFVISGSAYVVVRTPEGDQRTIVKNGEKIKIDPGVLHWHGATPETFMVHITNNMYNDHTFTYWFHHVADDEYRYNRSKRSYRQSEVNS